MTREIQTQNPDIRIAGQRTDFMAKLHPHVGQIISEDGGYSQAIAGLDNLQKEVFFGIVEEDAALHQFGRLSTEAIRTKKTQSGYEYIDPIKKRWDGQLRKAGIKDKEEREDYVSMAESMSEAVTVAYHMDPFIEK